ncbi:hypothetical protein ABZ570_03470 [Micromonospora sp. NPDC007271]|uniref:hypothetical protein n=1 Tax=Micromonospora sp. NPDC007271 TaxID=3154587 RepID=UPI0033EB1925
MSYSNYDVIGWAEAVANLHAGTAHDPSDVRRAYEAMASGYQDAPTEVPRILVRLQSSSW